MNNRIIKATLVLAILTALLTGWIILGGPFNTYYLIWNLILAWAPMVFSLIFIYNASKPASGLRMISKLISGLLWLFFFPNAVYIITDYIHLSNDSFYYSNPAYTPYSGLPQILYSFERLPWNNLLSITFAVFIGCALSVFSLYFLQAHIERRSSRLAGWGFAIFVHILSGYAIYLGRFIRFNSWDVIFNPIGLIRYLLSSINKTSFVFSLQFFILSFFIYVIFYLFIYVGGEDHRFTNSYREQKIL